MILTSGYLPELYKETHALSSQKGERPDAHPGQIEVAGKSGRPQPPAGKQSVCRRFAQGSHEKNHGFSRLSAILRSLRVYRRPRMRAIPAEKAGENRVGLAIMT